MSSLLICRLVDKFFSAWVQNIDFPSCREYYFFLLYTSFASIIQRNYPNMSENSLIPLSPAHLFQTKKSWFFFLLFLLSPLYVTVFPPPKVSLVLSPDFLLCLKFFSLFPEKSKCCTQLKIFLFSRRKEMTRVGWFQSDEGSQPIFFIQSFGE